MGTRAAWTLFTILACHGSQAEWHAVAQGEDSCPAPGSDEGALPVGKTPVCAPVISLQCAITLPCAVGTPRADGTFDVTTSSDGHIHAHLRRYCEGSRCFSALLTRDLNCDGCGIAQNADPTCHFESSVCK